MLYVWRLHSIPIYFMVASLLGGCIEFNSPANERTSTDTSAATTSTAPTQLELSGSATAIKTVCTTYTVTAKDDDGTAANAESDITIDLTGNGSGTFYSDSGCSSSITQVTLPSGSSSVTFYFKDATSESLTFSADDAAAELTGDTLAVTVTHGSLSTFTVASHTDPVTAGTASNIVVTAKDAYGNTVEDYTGEITFTSDDPQAVLPADYTFVGGDSGTKTFTSGVTLKTAGEMYVRAEDTSDGTKQGQQDDITVNPASATTLTVSGVTDPIATTAQSDIVVTAKDAYGNTATGYTGTVAFTSTDTGSTLPANYTFVGGDSGTKTFTNGYTANTAGEQSITATDTVTGTITGSQTAITVTAGGIDHFDVTGHSDPITAGTADTVTVVAKDAQNNTITNYTGTITFTSDDGAATLPADYTFVGGDSGSKTFTNGITLKTAGDKYVRVAVSGDATKNGQQSNITVNPAAAATLTVSGVTDPIASGAQSDIVVTAKDAYGNTATGYTGTVAFTSTDTGSTLPANYTFLGGDSGTKTFTNGYTANTAGEQSITATDTVTGTITGSQTAITVTAGGIDHFDVTGHSDPITAGTADTVTVVAKDAQNNTITNYTGTITFTSDDGSAVLPGDYTFVGGDSGSKTFTNGITLKTAGDKYVRVAVSGDATKNGQQSNITVNPAAAATLTVSGVTDPIASGAQSDIVVTAKDAYGNTATGYTGTVAFTSTDTGSTLPSNYTFLGGDSGTKTFTNGYTANTVGEQSITATDTVTGTITGSQTAITVQAAGIDHFTVTGFTDPVTAGTSGGVTVTAKDSSNNTLTSYTGTITFTSDDGSAVLPGDYTFVGGDSGVKSFTGIILKTTGEKYIKVEDTSDGTKNGSQTAITVNPGAIDHFLVENITDPVVAGTASNVQVTARDEFNNVKTDYTGTVTFSSSDSAATLPANTAFIGGDSGVKTISSVTLKTVGEQTVTATDTVVGAATGTQSNITVTADSASYVLITGPAAVSPSVCSTAYTVTTYDQYNNVANVGSNTTINLTGASNGTFYSDSSCSSSITSFVISSGSSSGTFYYKNATTEDVTLNAVDSGASLTDDDHAVSVETAYVVSGGIGTSHACVVRGNGKINCFGDNTYGQLGDGTTTDSLTMVEASGISSGSTQVKGGTSHTCALVNGGVKCWGRNNVGQLGDGTTTDRTSPVDVSGLTSGVTALDVHADTSCAIHEGKIKCWGEGSSGQLGNNASSDSSTAVAVENVGTTELTGAHLIAVGATHACATLRGGVMCWGNNTGGKLGDSSEVSKNYAVYATGLGIGSGVRGLSSGDNFTCAVVDGGVQCWGDNSNKQIGVTGAGNYTSPQSVTNLSSTAGVDRIVTGANHACAMIDGALECWGDNSSCELGEGDTTPSDTQTPTSTSGLSGVLEVWGSGGGKNTCALVQGNVKCWGENANGEVGNSSTSNACTPQNSQAFTAGITQLAVGTANSCLVDNGAMKCWGRNSFGEIGKGSTGDTSTPTATSGWGTSGVTSVAMANYSTCAVANGAVKCVGFGGDYQLGNNSTSNSTSWVQVSGLTSGVVKVVSVDKAYCALVNGGVKCWGDGSNLALGDGSSTDNQTPGDVTGLTSGVIDIIGGGGGHMCAITESSGMECWGKGTGYQTGEGSAGWDGTPVAVSGLAEGAIGGGLGDLHSCFLKAAGDLECVGQNTNGQIGDASTTEAQTITQVSGLTTGVSSVSTNARGSHSCAIVNGGLKCWGANDIGQLGDGTTTQRTSPVDVSGLTSSVSLVSGGQDHTCAIYAGVPKCWGENANNRLGDGTSTDRSSPTTVSGY